MTKTLENATEIEKKGGAVLASQWTTGTGNYIAKRPVPKFCKEIYVELIGTLKGKTAAAAKRLVKAHPRARKLVVVHDRRALNHAVTEAQDGESAPQVQNFHRNR